MQGRFTVFRRVPLLAAILVLAATVGGCTTTSNGTAASGRQLALADKLSREQQFAAAAAQYEDIAKQSSPELRNRLLLRAARDWLRAEDLPRGEGLLRQVGDAVAPADQTLRTLVAARVALLSQRPDQALSELDRIPQPLPRDEVSAILELRAKALFAYGKPAGAVITALDREQLLGDQAEVMRNRRMIWDGIQRSATSGANLQAPIGASRPVTGWLELGRAALIAARSPFAAQAAIDDWRGKYPEHVANEFLNQQVMPQLRTAVTYPAQLALLLPLSGRWQSLGIAVRDGFIAALMQQPLEQRPTLRVYDSAASGVLAAYTQAATEGAKFIVGPLLKEDVATLTQSGQLTLPTLALNYPTEQATSIANLYLFALDPPEEAQQVAARIAAAGLTHGVALLPNNDKGQRVQRAFETEFALHGGSLVSTRLYDPTEGMVRLNGQDIRSFAPAQRALKIGFILQDPFLFTGTVLENILYGNEELQALTEKELAAELKKAKLSGLLQRFEKGLETKITSGTDTMSLGQRQLIAFMRAVLRKPELLILDEATANVDTITEQLLEDILKNLPKETTRVIIAHRLNTIENADEIFFVNSGELTRAGSFDHAVDMLLHGKRNS